jgi:hypothetical protein
LFIGIVSFSSSCKKEKDTVAKIRVISEDNIPLSNAMVRLWPNPDIILGAMVPADTVYTKSDGYASFDYTDDFKLGNAGFRVLDIEVNVGDTLFGSGIIKIVEETISTEVVVVSGI